MGSSAVISDVVISGSDKSAADHSSLITDHKPFGQDGSPRNLFTITEEFSRELLRRISSEPHNRVRALLH